MSPPIAHLKFLTRPVIPLLLMLCFCATYHVTIATMVDHFPGELEIRWAIESHEGLVEMEDPLGEEQKRWLASQTVASMSCYEWLERVHPLGGLEHTKVGTATFCKVEGRSDGGGDEEEQADKKYYRYQVSMHETKKASKYHREPTKDVMEAMAQEAKTRLREGADLLSPEEKGGELLGFSFNDEGKAGYMANVMRVHPNFSSSPPYIVDYSRRK